MRVGELELKKRILACLCALVCLCSNATRSDALFGDVIDNAVGIVVELSGALLLELSFVASAKKKRSFGKYHCLSVLTPILFGWDIIKRITYSSQLSDLQNRNLENSDKGKANSKGEGTKNSKKA